MIEERKCKGPCGKWKPLIAYSKDLTMKDGLRSKCRECINAQNREYKRGCSKGRPKPQVRVPLDARDEAARELFGHMQTYWNVVVNAQPMGSIR